MFSFYWPWFAIILPLPFIFRLLAQGSKADETGSPAVISFPNLDRFMEKNQIMDKNKSPDDINKKENKPGRGNMIFFILLSLFWFGIVATLMRPQMISNVEDVRLKGYDIMLAVDLSASMAALDFSTQTSRINRLQKTKQVLKSFISKRRTDRMGLILFADHAYLQVPMTRDINQVTKMLDNAEIGMAGNTTAIGDTIGVAIRELRTRSENSRILILLTDGEDTASSISPEVAARIAKNHDIRIYTIGIGKDGAVPFPDNFGRITMVEAGIDDELLETIAKTTGGIYFRAENGEALERIYEKVNELEKISFDTNQYQISTPLFRYPLIFSAVIFLLIVFLPLQGGKNYD